MCVVYVFVHVCLCTPADAGVTGEQLLCLAFSESCTQAHLNHTYLLEGFLESVLYYRTGIFILKGLRKKGGVIFLRDQAFCKWSEAFKTSHCLSQFSDVLLERILPDFTAQAPKFQDLGEPRVEHIKREGFPKHRTVLFSLEFGENCCLEKLPRFLWLVTHPRSFPGTDSQRPHSLPASQCTTSVV